MALLTISSSFFSVASTSDPCPFLSGAFLMLFINNTLITLLPPPCLSSDLCWLLSACGLKLRAGAGLPLLPAHQGWPQGSGSAHSFQSLQPLPQGLPACPPGEHELRFHLLSCVTWPSHSTQEVRVLNWDRLCGDYPLTCVLPLSHAPRFLRVAVMS